jgi:hypothetical protein
MRRDQFPQEDQRLMENLQQLLELEGRREWGSCARQLPLLQELFLCPTRGNLFQWIFTVLPLKRKPVFHQ